MSVALGRVKDQIYGADDTPSNVDNRMWWENADNFLDAANAITPSDNDTASKRVIDSFNDAVVRYKTFTSTYGEFGSTRWPSFSQAVYESVQELPSTVGNAIGAVVDTAGLGVESLVASFFKRLGIWGWLLLIGAALALLTYVYPQWITMLKGAVAK